VPRPLVRSLQLTATLTLLVLLWRVTDGTAALGHLAGADPVWLAAATTFIDDVTEMVSDTFLPGFAPAGEPIARIELLRRGTGGESATMYRDGERYVALRDGESVGYVLSEEQVERLRTPRLALRDRVVVDIPSDTITKLTLTHRGQTQTRYMRSLGCSIPRSGSPPQSVQRL